MKFLTPHLTQSAPELANAVPYLLALGALGFLAAMIAAVFMIRFHSRLTAEQRGALFAKNWPNTLRQLQRRLGRARCVLLAFAALAGVAWMALVSTGNADSLLSEIVFVVIGIGLIVPIALALSLLQAAFRISAEQLERSQEGSS